MELNPPKKVQTRETKEKIYNAAMSILKKKGYAYLTVSNICKVAGVSNGTFFYHFKTKDDLFNYYTFENFAKFRRSRHFDEAVKDLSIKERIIRFYDYWADYMAEIGLDFFSNFYHTKNYALDVRLWNKRKPVSIWNYPGECLDEAKAAGELRDGTDVNHCAEVLGTIIKGIAFDWCLSGAAFEMKPRIREVMVPYLDSIFS